jgi:hypothetical protein
LFNVITSPHRIDNARAAILILALSSLGGLKALQIALPQLSALKTICLWCDQTIASTHEQYTIAHHGITFF